MGHLIRVAPGEDQKTMDLLEEAVRSVEFFMYLPLPIRTVNVLFADAVTPSYAGNNFQTGIAILPEHENDQKNLGAMITHEVAHYYWSENRNWIDERMADLIATYQRWETAGAAITASKYPCSRADNIR